VLIENKASGTQLTQELIALRAGWVRVDGDHPAGAEGRRFAVIGSAQVMPVGSHVKSAGRATAGGGTGVREAADELFLMTDLFPATTGLPMAIWVGPSYSTNGGSAQSDRD
jgi:hypothetical protein